MRAAWLPIGALPFSKNEHNISEGMTILKEIAASWILLRFIVNKTSITHLLLILVLPIYDGFSAELVI
jgi:hypothetical protein